MLIELIDLRFAGNPFYITAAGYKNETFPIKFLNLHGTKSVELPLVA